jgi:hypothetical protein
MKRRHFIGGSAVVLLAPVAVEWPFQSAPAALHSQADYTFFDRRFGKARQIAASWPTSPAPIAVLGDITPWSDLLSRAPSERALRLTGLTTESFRFCTAILVGERADFDMRVSRLDQDLILWTMRTTPKEKHHG